MRLRRLIGVVILALCVGGPIVEAFDRWDNTLQDGYDTEANVVVVALCVGLALSVSAIALTWFRSASSVSCGYRPDPDRPCLASGVRSGPLPTGSPPTPLRI